ncbi:unnamed protein product [Closterium sp. NIES-54]
MMPRPGPLGGAGSGTLEPTYSGAFSEQGGEYDNGYPPRGYTPYGGGGGSGEQQAQPYGQYPQQQQYGQQQQQYPIRGSGGQQPGGWGGGGGGYGDMGGGHGGGMQGQAGMRGAGGYAPGARRGYGSNESSPSGSGTLQPVYGNPAPGGGGSGGLAPTGTRFSMDGGAEGQWGAGGGGGGGGGSAGGAQKSPGGPNDIQQAAALSALAWSQAANSQEGQRLQSDYMAEFDAWKQSNQAATYQQQQDFMSDLQARMAKARAALAGLQLGGDGGSGTGSPAGAGGGAPGAGSGEMQARLMYPAPIPAPIPDGPATGGSGGQSANEVRRVSFPREMWLMLVASIPAPIPALVPAPIPALVLLTLHPLHLFPSLSSPFSLTLVLPLLPSSPIPPRGPHALTPPFPRFSSFPASPSSRPSPLPSARLTPSPPTQSHLHQIDLRRELEVMRQRAAEAEHARLEAEQRAQRALSEADRSLREVEAQNKRRELETAVRIEMASQEASRAIAAAEEARKQAGLEAQKTEVAMKQAAMTRAALEMESQKRVAVELKAKGERGSQRMAANYRDYSYEDIVFATENFKPERKLGEGGFGTVFSGTLHHTPVAVKVLKNADAMQAANEFQQEVEVLSQIQHPHVVMLLGCCPSKYCLVYEFMANGSLEDRLLCANGSPPLPWYIRMRVAAEIASALLILHTRPVPIVHRDLKPGNILLDKNFVAKLGDVGLAKLMPGLSMDQTYMRESVPVGTFAYVDPEFQRTGEFGPKSDVYALGIVLLDLLTGRKPNVYEGLEEAVDDGDENELKQFLDERAGDWPLDMVMEVARIAVKCSEMRRKKRPDLEKQVMPVLDRARARAAQAEEEARKAPSRRPMGEAPSVLFCPITQEMMVNPVLAADGHTYEQEAIKSWLETSDMSPMTNQKLPSKDLVANHAVRSMILDWRQRNG